MREKIMVLLIALLLITLCLGATQAANKAKKPGPQIYDLSPDDFVLMPWTWLPGDAKVLNELKDCGFNMAGFVSPEDVPVVKKVGLKCIVYDKRMSNVVSGITKEEIDKRAKDVIAPFKGNPTVRGYYLRDEPTTSMFETLANWKDAIAREDPKALAYIDLFPMIIGNYDEYVDKYISMVKPEFLCYDHYALFDDGSVRDTLYQNLEVIRKKAMQQNIPYWNIILSNTHFNYALPSQAGFYIQVYSSLAYGVRGIVYFTYIAPSHGNFRDAPLDPYLNKTPTWDMVRNVNLQVHQLAPAYLKLKSINVFHYPNVPAGCSGIETSKYIKELGGGDYLVGEFESPDGRPYVMLVNKDIHKSVNFSIIFKWPGKVMAVNQYTGAEYPAGGEADWLAPGQGILLSLIKQ